MATAVWLRQAFASYHLGGHRAPHTQRSSLETGYPRLAPALVGFLHGVWHLPLMLLTTAYNPVGDRFIVVPLFLAVLTAAGILYGYPRDAFGASGQS